MLNPIQIPKINVIPAVPKKRTRNPEVESCKQKKTYDRKLLPSFFQNENPDFNAEGLKVYKQYTQPCTKDAACLEITKGYFRRAAEAGNIDACLNLAIVLRDYPTSAIDGVDALICFLKVCEKATQLGKAEAHIQTIIFSSDGIENNKAHIDSFLVAIHDEVETLGEEELEEVLEYLKKARQTCSETFQAALLEFEKKVCVAIEEVSLNNTIKQIEL